MLICFFKKKPTIIQYQIDGFLKKGKKITFDMSILSQYRKGRILMNLNKGPKKKGRKKKETYGRVKLLTDYSIKMNEKYMTKAYLLDFKKYVRAPTEEGKKFLSPLDMFLYWEVDGFDCFFDDLFHFTDLSIFDKWEQILEEKGLMRVIPSLHDIFVYECLRIQLGIETYAQFWRILLMLNPFALVPLLHNKKFIPTDQDFSDFYHVLPLEAFEELYWNLVEELNERKPVSSRILIWDCQFIHSNSSDYNSNDSSFYTDRDASLGRHNNKFLGVGYMASTLSKL